MQCYRDYPFICAVYTTDRIRSRSVHGEAKQTPRSCSTLDEAFYFVFLLEFLQALNRIFSGAWKLRAEIAHAGEVENGLCFPKPLLLKRFIAEAGNTLVKP